MHSTASYKSNTNDCCTISTDVGILQMHIDTGEDISRTPGPVKLFLPDLHALQHQLDKLAPRMKDTKFRADFSPDHHQATVVDPWGQKFSISEKQSTHVREGSTIGSFEGLLLPCHRGTARAVGQFYRTMLQVILLAHFTTHAAVQIWFRTEVADKEEVRKVYAVELHHRSLYAQKHAQDMK